MNEIELAIKVLENIANCPIESFGWEETPERQIYGVNQIWGLYVKDVLNAREALKKIKGGQDVR